jgi:pimeloyl-ACP methyl ester carboxylesterase
MFGAHRPGSADGSPPDADTLFLHGGPGLCALPERQRFGDSLSVYWWDQPRSVMLFANPFNELVDLAEDELLRMADRRRGPVRLLAHSFGAVLALHLAVRQPEAIDTVDLLAPVSHVGGAFARLALRLCAVRGSDRHRLLAARERYLAASGDLAAFGDLTQAILATPDFIDLYWAPASADKRNAFKSLLERGGLFDVATFDAVARDHLHVPRLQAITRVRGRVRIVLGRYDPLIDPDAEASIWRGYFPTATTHRLDVGHFVQFEADPSAWLAAAAPQ